MFKNTEEKVLETRFKSRLDQTPAQHFPPHPVPLSGHQLSFPFFPTDEFLSYILILALTGGKSRFPSTEKNNKGRSC